MNTNYEINSHKIEVEKKFTSLMESGEKVIEIKYCGLNDYFKSPTYEIYTDYGFIYVVILHNDHVTEVYSDLESEDN